MWANSQETADLVRFTKDIFNGKLHFLYSGRAKTLNLLSTPQSVVQI